MNQNKYKESIEYSLKALKYKKIIGDKRDIAITLGNIAMAYYKQDLFADALKENIEAAKILIGIEDKTQLSNTWSNMALIYLAVRKLDSTEFYLKKADELNKKIGDLNIRASILTVFSNLYFLEKNYKLAEIKALEAWKISVDLKSKENLRDISEAFSKIYEASGDFKNALKYQKLFKSYNDSMINTENQKRTQQIEMKYEYDKKENELITQQKLKDTAYERLISSHKFWTNFLLLIFVFLLIIIVLEFRSRIQQKRINRKLKELNDQVLEKNTELEERNEEINRQKEEIECQIENFEVANQKITLQKNEIEKSHHQITSSITYASRIQNAILPKQELIQQFFPEHFIFYQPKDIVSGDFYYFKSIRNLILIAAVDCTGHGVPGAFMSMLGTSILSEVVRKQEVVNSAQVLEELRAQLKESLQQTGQKGEQQDGMDIAFCTINSETLELSFAGAHNPIWIFRQQAENQAVDFFELEPNAQPVGVYHKESGFTESKFQLQKGDVFYLFSDGYHSQFGGEKRLPMKSKYFKELLFEICSMPLDEQKLVLAHKFETWKAQNDQTDDVLVLGVKV